MTITGYGNMKDWGSFGYSNRTPWHDAFVFRQIKTVAAANPGWQRLPIGNGVTNIGTLAFEYCEALTSITIGIGVTSIGGGAFSECTMLADVFLKT